jgi:arylsulfatase A-like enzyme
MYDPDTIELGPDADDWFENQWAGRPEHNMSIVRNRMGGRTRDDLRRALAHYFALISVIDMEIGRILHWLEENDLLDNTIIVYTADHGDFAGDHGLCFKNIGIYESIHRIPFLLAYPGGPRGVERDGIIESVDLLPTLCELADVPLPGELDGRSLLSVAAGESPGRDRAICEWDFPAPQRRVNAIRTRRHRLVYHGHELGGELYDHETDPHEMHNCWEEPAYAGVRMELLERLFDEVNRYQRKSDFDRDARLQEENFYTPTRLLHKRWGKWSEIEALYRG